jgi:hypothetical protein
MKFFKKITQKRVQLIKVVQFDNKGKWETHYQISVNGNYIVSSWTKDEVAANRFFDKVLETNGCTKYTEIVKEKFIQ